MTFKVMVDGVVRDATDEEAALIAATQSQVVVPQSVTRRQGRQALFLGGYLSKVQPIIDAMADPNQKGLTQIWWDDAETFDRNNPTLIQMGTALGLDSTGLDNLFIQAATL